MAKVLAVLPGNTAIVSTENLFRVVIGEGRKRKIHGELVGFEDAAFDVDCFKRANMAAQAIPDTSLAVPERDDAWLQQYDSSYPQVLAIVPRCVVVPSVGWYRVANERGVPMHEFCDLDSADSLASGKYHIGKGRRTKDRAISYDELASNLKTQQLCLREAVS